MRSEVRAWRCAGAGATLTLSVQRRRPRVCRSARHATAGRPRADRHARAGQAARRTTPDQQHARQGHACDGPRAHSSTAVGVIRVLVVDDHPIVRQGLVSVLADEDDLEVVGEAGSGREAVALVARAAARRRAAGPGDAGARRRGGDPAVAGGAPAVGVLVFTAYDTDDRVLGRDSRGARGYLLKGASADEIARGIRSVHAGGSYLEPRVASKLWPKLARPVAARSR